MSLRITANSPAKSTDFPAKTNTREGSGPPGQTACFSLLYSFLEAAFYTVKLTAFFPDSYYSDKETGFYYLQSRYYDPALGRFINADNYASTGQGFLGYNMFAYCRNNPAHTSDPTGQTEEAWKWWLDGAGGYAGASIGGGIAGSDPLPSGASSVGGALGLSGGADGQTALKSSIAAVALMAHLLRRGSGNIYTVYFLTDRQHKYNKNGPIYYVGRVKTANREVRFNYHKNTRDLYLAYYYDGLTYEQARGIEEMGMIAYGTLKHEYPYNIIHGISPQNPRRGLYLFDGMDYLEHHVEQEVLDIYESYFY